MSHSQVSHEIFFFYLIAFFAFLFLFISLFVCLHMTNFTSVPRWQRSKSSSHLSRFTYLHIRGVSTMPSALDVKLGVHLLIGLCSLWTLWGKQGLCPIYLQFLGLRITIKATFTMVFHSHSFEDSLVNAFPIYNERRTATCSRFWFEPSGLFNLLQADTLLFLLNLSTITTFSNYY